MIEKILPKIKVGKANRIKLTHKRSSIEVWWETKDKWFLNIKTTKDKESMWIIQPDVISHFNFLYPEFKIKDENISNKK